MKPSIALVGRPNVGKSALFNRICRKRIAIVDAAEGSTRDRLYADAEWFGRSFLVMDAGGIEKPEAAIQKCVQQQTSTIIAQADVLIMVADAQAGATQDDLQIARKLHRTGKPLLLAANKIDTPGHEGRLHTLSSLDIPAIPVSALHGYNVAELIEAAQSHFPQPEEKEASDSPLIKIALVGKTNVGKSTLLNRLAGEARSVVSPEAGTTRDSIAAILTRGEKEYRCIDTAGIRNKKSESGTVEKFAAIRTKAAIESADVCIHLLDVDSGVTFLDKKISKQIESAGKSCLVLLNKWDLAEKFRMEHALALIRKECPHKPILCISAKTGRNLDKIWPTIEQLYQSSSSRVPTHPLNKFLSQIFQASPPPAIKGKRLRLYYATQASVSPPQFVFFINHPSYVAESYKRYLLNQLRKEFSLNGVPIELVFRGKGTFVN